MSEMSSFRDAQNDTLLKQTIGRKGSQLRRRIHSLFFAGTLLMVLTARLAAQQEKFVVVIDPGHGGTKNLPGSNANNAIGPVTKTLEKDLTLKYCQALCARLRNMATEANKNVSVILTRDTDANLTAEQRTYEVRRNKAPIFLVLHFNDDGGSGKVRGSLYVDRVDKNVNRAEDNALAEKIVAACVRGLVKTDPEAHRLDPVVYKKDFPAVSSDELQGNTKTSARTRMAYLETEFLNNPRIDELLNKNSHQDRVMNDVCDELSKAILNEVR
jgi:N-acetylmuramoyl-L-alanine amidase